MTYGVWGFFPIRLSGLLKVCCTLGYFILNKKGILGKVLLVLFVALFVFGVSNFVTNGYISRSMNDKVSLIEEVIVENDVTEIKINESTTFVKVFYGDVENITLKYYNEFNNKLEYNNENGVFIIDSINQKVFDLFGLLDEPLSKIEIVLPINNNLNKLDLTLNGGYFDIVDYNGSLTIDIKGSSSTYAITRSTFSSLVVDGYNLSIACEENNIANVNLKLKDGKSYFMNNTVNEFFVENHLADLVIQDANIETLNITNTSARAALDKINANSITYKDQNSESLLQYVYSNNMKVSSLGNSDITLDKVIVEDTIALDNSAGSFDLRFIKAKNISTEVLKKAGYLDDLEEILAGICDKYTWILPAHSHLKNGKFDYTVIDLYSAETAFYLSETAFVFGDKLSIDIRDRIEYSLKTKIVENFEKREKKNEM